MSSSTSFATSAFFSSVSSTPISLAFQGRTLALSRSSMIMSRYCWISSAVEGAAMP